MSPSPTLLNRLYGGLALVATVAVGKAIAFPSAPRHTPLDAAAITSALAASAPPAQAQASRPAEDGYELAHSSILHYRWSDGRDLRLVQATVRQLDSFQISFIARDLGGLKLKRRQVLTTQGSSAIGQVKGRGARQTCLVPGVKGPGAWGVTVEELGTAANQNNTGIRNKLVRMLGLRPNHVYRCVLISLRNPEATPPDDRSWEQLLTQLRPALEREAPSQRGQPIGSSGPAP